MIDSTAKEKQEPGPSTQGVHLWLLLWKATKSMEAQARRSVEATGLCLSDFGVLEALLHKGPLSVSVLGRKVLLSSGSITAAVDRLERGRLVKRANAQTDRRSRIVHLTSAGSKLIRRVFAEHARDMEHAFSSLTRPEREAAGHLLRKLGRAVEALPDNPEKRDRNNQTRR